MKAGAKIKMVAMIDDPDPIPPGTTGVVLSVQHGFRPGETVLAVRWDNGRSLNVVTPPDIVVEIAAT